MPKAILKSVLEDILTQYSGQQFKKESVLNALKNRGVKDAELEQSGVKDYITSLASSKVTVNEIADIAGKRQDTLGSKDIGSSSHFIREPEYAGAKGYTAEVYTKDSADKVQNHFNVPDYYSHARYTDTTKDRVVHELQSDKHSPGVKKHFDSLSDDELEETSMAYIYSAITTKLPENLSDDAVERLAEDSVDLFNEAVTARLTPSEILSRAEDFVDSVADTVGNSGDLSAKELAKEMRTYQLETRELIKDINFKKDSRFLQNTVNKLLVDTFNEGQTSIKFRIADDPNLNRSPGVQKWYDTTVKNTLEKTAKKIGAKTNFDGKYLAVTLPAAGFALPAYANDSFMEQAKKAGYTEEEIQQYLENKNTTEQSPSQQQLQEISPDTNKVLEDDNFIHKAKEAGYTYDEIQEYLEKKNTPDAVQPAEQSSEVEETNYNTEMGVEDFQTPQGVQTATVNTDVQEEVENATDLAATYSNIYSRWSTLGKMAIGATFDEEQMSSAIQDIQKLNNGLVKKLREKGVNAYIDPDNGLLMMQDENGQQHEIEPGIFDDILASKFETGGAIAGAISGAKWGAKGGAALALAAGQLGPQVIAPEEIVTVPVASAIGGALGAFGGGALGAFGGSGLDYLINSYKLKDELDAKVVLSKMVDAGVADATMTILVGGAWKIAKPVGVRTIKVIGHAFNMFKNGNQKGAYKILLKDQNITKEQASDIVEKWKKLSGITKPEDLPKITNDLGVKKAMTDEQLAVKVITETRPGGEAVIAASEGSSIPITHVVNARAKYLMDTVDKLAPGEPAKEIRHALQDYQIEVGKYYETVKNLAGDMIDRTDYRFDIDKLTIKPAMQEARKHIDDPFQVERFKNVMERIDSMANTRTFSDLLDLRQSVNAVKAKATKKVAQDSLKKSIMTIDREIQRVTDEYLPKEQAKVWRQQFKRAKQEYAKMKQLESNVLFKAIVSKKGVTEDQIVKKLSDLAPALDDTFVDVMRKLPKGLKDKTEGAIVKILTERYTVGLPSELQAVHFPELANKLAKYNFQSPATKQYVGMVQEFAEVFKNDVHLGRTIGNIQIPKFQSYLTTDPVMRAKYEFASGVFNIIKQLVPNAKADRLALVKMVGNMLDDPLKAKETQLFIKRFPKAQQVEIAQMVKNLRHTWAQAGLNTAESKEALKLYKATSKEAVTRTNGGFGPGYYLRESLQNPRETRGVLRYDIEPSQLATLKEISKLMGREVSHTEVRKLKSLPGKLKKAGFKGVRHDGRVMLFEKPK